jgi:ssDNA-binding Zn-finger/Zn-ribbon topoisomerase 1
MGSQIALKIKCPVCSKSLMDPRHKLDGQPSVSLDAACDGKKGWLRLSPVYGSYTLESEHPLPKGAIVRVYCPKCKAELASTVHCDQCQAPMVPLLMAEGGKVYVCSRKGCKKHFLEFEDVDEALAKFYDAYALDSGKLPPRQKAKPPAAEPDDDKAIMASGSFLQAYCPHCHCSLIDRSSLAFTVIGRDDREGVLLLSPYLNVFTNKSTVEIPHGDEVKDLRCPHCRHSLIAKGDKCDRCGSRTAKITVGAMNKLLSFFICLRKGCTWHGLSDEDTKLIMLEDSKEW